MSAWSKAYFTIDSIPDRTFEGYTDGDDWNGWACPYFEYHVAEDILRNSELNDFVWAYDPTADAFVVRIKSDSVDFESEEFKATRIKLGDQELTVYGIGAYSWIWEQA